MGAGQYLDGGQRLSTWAAVWVTQRSCSPETCDDGEVVGVDAAEMVAVAQSRANRAVSCVSPSACPALDNG
jgi:hypothetical protein